MDLLKKRPYEISIWEEVPKIAVWNGESVDILTDAEYQTQYGEFNPSIARRFFDEEKICTIGAHDMTSQHRAFSPKLNQNIKSKTTFTFTMYYRFKDEITGEEVENIFIPYMAAERKVKLRIDGEEGQEPEWFDFVIKQISENSSNNTFTYTCDPLETIELGKNGFNLVFDESLGNNSGTSGELAVEILKDTDWKFDEEQSQNIFQTIEETCYRVRVGIFSEIPKISVIKDKDNLSEIQVNLEFTPGFIEEGHYIYIPYSCVANKTLDFYQVFYCGDKEPKVNEDLVIIDEDCEELIIPSSFIDSETGFIKEERLIVENENGEQEVNFSQISTDYMVRRHVYSQKSGYDPNIDWPILKYSKDDKEYYGYSRSKILVSDLTQNIIANGKDFTSAEVGTRPDGWLAFKGGTIERSIKYADENKTEPIANIIELNGQKGSLFYNNGLYTNAGLFPDGLSIGDKFICDWAVASGTIQTNLYIAEFKYDKNGDIEIDEVISEKAPLEETGEERHYYYKYNIPYGYENVKDGTRYGRYITITKSVSQEKLLKGRIGIFWEMSEDPKNVPSFYEVRMFKYVPYKHDHPQAGNILFLDPDEETPPQGEVVVEYSYYDPKQSSLYDVNTIEYAYRGFEKNESYIPQMTFEKIRAIQGSESNRFNLIQSICETFECWAKFKIGHESNGAVKKTFSYNNEKLEIDYDKKVILKQYIGKRNYAGFKKGINLSSITRNVASGQIATKIIVKPNANSAAQNGFCTIQRALSNPTRENYILNFSHFVKKKLINPVELKFDLYGDEKAGYIGLYKFLQEKNVERDLEIDRQSAYNIELTKCQADLKTYQLLEQEAYEKKVDMDKYIDGLTAAGVASGMELDGAKEEKEYFEVQYARAQQEINKLTGEEVDSSDNPKGKIPYYKKKLDEIKSRLEEIRKEKEAKEKELMLKYGRFIQEGSWISEDYYDDDLYYQDAIVTAHTSANPQISYTFSVLELSQLPEFKYYNFDIADVTFIEDTDFFGYMPDGSDRPYQEDIVISGVERNLDAPDQNKLTAQNYKTQFDDLFQRVAAATQTVEYKGGSFARAADAVSTNGSINPDALQNALKSGILPMGNSQINSVTQGADGLTVAATMSVNKNYVTKIQGDGIYFSADGGLTADLKLGASGITGDLRVSGYLQIGKYIQLRNMEMIIGRPDQENETYMKLTNEALAFMSWDGNSRLKIMELNSSNRDSEGKLAPYIRIGQEGSLNTFIKNDSIRIGKENGVHFYISPSEIHLGNRAVDDPKCLKYFEVNSENVFIRKSEKNYVKIAGDSFDIYYDSSSFFNIKNNILTLTGKGNNNSLKFNCQSNGTNKIITDGELYIQSDKSGGDAIRVRADGENSRLELRAYPSNWSGGVKSLTAIYFTAAKLTSATGWSTEHNVIQMSLIDPAASTYRSVNYYFTTRGIFCQNYSGELKTVYSAI